MSEQYKTNSKLTSDTPVPRRSWQQRLLAVGLIVILLVAGTFLTRYLLRNKPQVGKRPPAKMQTLVKVMAVMPENSHVVVKAQGRVVPAQEVSLEARVAGRVVALHPRLKPGGMIARGEVLVALDDTDYRLALRAQQDALARAQADLRIEEGNQMIALQEWETISRLTGEMESANVDLALRKPQLAKAQANLESALTAVEKARVDLQRTVIKAPFNLIVSSKNVDLGSQVSLKSVIATLVGLDTFWAEISLPVEKLDWLDLPAAGRPGSSATLYVNGDISSYEGRIISLQPELDPDGLMARLLIAVDDPMGLKGQRKPLFLGSFVRAEMVGRTVAGVYRIPRSALKENSRVLTADSDGRLRSRTVAVLWKDTDFVLISQGLDAGDRVIISNVPAPIEGMLLEIIADGSGEAAANNASGRETSK
ncbi:MAG: efflux RND transporter periplasmic adaptor subunit [Deltaproteobacteria bacterium]|nr:efflux RND transporter periplasmic adaptor subunit [Candidatus Anaeroferrophillus wilburensis]MBN2888405.1 efflux RND transporter periplasmic adaptor subunit [Deltaproteobacteria bacterium]